MEEYFRASRRAVVGEAEVEATSGSSTSIYHVKRSLSSHSLSAPTVKGLISFSKTGRLDLENESREEAKAEFQEQYCTP